MTLCAGPQQRDFQQENLQAKQARVDERKCSHTYVNSSKIDYETELWRLLCWLLMNISDSALM